MSILEVQSNVNAYEGEKKKKKEILKETRSENEFISDLSFLWRIIRVKFRRLIRVGIAAMIVNELFDSVGFKL